MKTETGNGAVLRLEEGNGSDPETNVDRAASRDASSSPSWMDDGSAGGPPQGEGNLTHASIGAVAEASQPKAASKPASAAPTEAADAQDADEGTVAAALAAAAGVLADGPAVADPATDGAMDAGAAVDATGCSPKPRWNREDALRAIHAAAKRDKERAVAAALKEAARVHEEEMAQALKDADRERGEALEMLRGELRREREERQHLENEVTELKSKLTAAKRSACNRVLQLQKDVSDLNAKLGLATDFFNKEHDEVARLQRKLGASEQAQAQLSEMVQQLVRTRGAAVDPTAALSALAAVAASTAALEDAAAPAAGNADVSGAVVPTGAGDSNNGASGSNPCSGDEADRLQRPSPPPAGLMKTGSPPPGVLGEAARAKAAAKPQVVHVIHQKPPQGFRGPTLGTVRPAAPPAHREHRMSDPGMQSPLAVVAAAAAAVQQRDRERELLAARQREVREATREAALRELAGCDDGETAPPLNLGTVRHASASGLVVLQQGPVGPRPLGPLVLTRTSAPDLGGPGGDMGLNEDEGMTGGAQLPMQFQLRHQSHLRPQPLQAIMRPAQMQGGMGATGPVPSARAGPGGVGTGLALLAEAADGGWPQQGGPVLQLQHVGANGPNGDAAQRLDVVAARLRLAQILRNGGY
ncbi:hypothetical protein HYH03_018119 [Edaphochlamys debaryana]|uniref:Uncharacterized protein n=1 Tax=Edaphochlamys debaryana TaxID=47281 RepID=A0A836BPR0_9CHLO|nr:hypothetical protein HYH03_018119 [Edaphochlamys debaryana]|eukprot:KAG2482994.1 hypothetical protein HYH03_018119 [Edaphochlamys debaryana]